jgi:hypothetical protein
MILIKCKAKWKPVFRKRFLQYLASLKALITYPFFKRIDDGIKLFFEENYKIKQDPLIFDGHTNRYLDQISNVMDLTKLNDVDIIDLGCGIGSFISWLEKNGINPRSYLGIDFACDGKVFSDNMQIINQNIFDYEISQNNYAILINVVGYLDDNQLNDILIKTRKKNCKLIIIEPYPHFFWDKHFNGIKLCYRRTERLTDLLYNKGYEIRKVSIDYFNNLSKRPISYCIFAN